MDPLIPKVKQQSRLYFDPFPYFSPPLPNVPRSNAYSVNQPSRYGTSRVSSRIGSACPSHSPTLFPVDLSSLQPLPIPPPSPAPAAPQHRPPRTIEETLGDRPPSPPLTVIPATPSPSPSPPGSVASHMGSHRRTRETHTPNLPSFSSSGQWEHDIGRLEHSYKRTLRPLVSLDLTPTPSPGPHPYRSPFLSPPPYINSPAQSPPVLYATQQSQSGLRSPYVEL